MPVRDDGDVRMREGRKYDYWFQQRTDGIDKEV